VVQEKIVVKKMNLLDGRLGNKVKHVTACCASTYDGDLLPLQLLIG